MVSWRESICRSLFLLAASFWVYLSALFVPPLFHAVHKLLLRCNQVEDLVRNSEVKNNTPNSSRILHQVEEKISMVTAPVETEEPDSSVSDTIFIEEVVEREPHELFLSFKFPCFEEFSRNNVVGNDSDSFSGVISAEEEEVQSCSPQESTLEPYGCSSAGNMETLAGKASKTIVRIYHDFVEKEADKVTEYNDDSPTELLKELKSHLISGEIPSEQKKLHFHALSKKDIMVSDSDTESLSSSHDFSIMSRLLDSDSEGLFSDEDEAPCKEERKHKEEEEDHEEEEEEASISHSHSRRLEDSTGGNHDDSRLEMEWEHQDLIEQLRMEIRKVKAAMGLPTIAEDRESPRILDAMKPWMIDERLHGGGRGGGRNSELHKVYRSYRERMRKFDILNYQKMYALGFLQSNDPFNSIPAHKAPTPPPSPASLLWQTIRQNREKKRCGDGPKANFVRELQGDLETVYVGQLCLSWEFLKWQYEKALELWELDSYNLRRYNEVADEFQQLQVLLQRFMENEQFEGPRVQYYVKSLCFRRNLLQVPVIREDNLKVKKKTGVTKGEAEYGVSIDMLVEIIEESIRIFWRFIRTDKDANTSTQKGLKKFHRPDLQDPANSKLFLELQLALQKKEKTLKEVLREGNCILRKLRIMKRQLAPVVRIDQDQEDSGSSSCSDHRALAFLSHVDMKLVRRVLNMSRLSTDQLAWCSGKLSRISFARPAMNADPSFLLFPC
ncbi:hypothetical protein SAY86_022708 [Trapa natans]|uniref:Ribosomal protein L34Ae n=1 Tax=Trapa natans TaxID=22666 RepID=A0AAN7RAW4_TRANT|nr:hypothetical protein SAY86_022708 [Trapa natans]